MAMNYNQASWRFSEFLIDSVKVTMFDTFYHDKPEIIKVNAHLINKENLCF